MKSTMEQFYFICRTFAAPDLPEHYQAGHFELKNFF